MEEVKKYKYIIKLKDGSELTAYEDYSWNLTLDILNDEHKKFIKLGELYICIESISTVICIDTTITSQVPDECIETYDAEED